VRPARQRLQHWLDICHVVLACDMHDNWQPVFMPGRSQSFWCFCGGWETCRLSMIWSSLRLTSVGTAQNKQNTHVAIETLLAIRSVLNGCHATHLMGIFVFDPVAALPARGWRSRST
jgi:hypothetical protein